MFKKIVFISFCLIAFSGCVSFDGSRPIFLHGFDYKVDCGNGKRMMSYELCRLDSSGY